MFCTLPSLRSKLSLPCLCYYSLQYYKDTFSKILITSSRPIFL